MAFLIYMYMRISLIENALFKRSGDICRPPLPFLPFNELSMDKRDSDCFIKEEECVGLAVALITGLTHPWPQ